MGYEPDPAEIVVLNSCTPTCQSGLLIPGRGSPYTARELLDGRTRASRHRAGPADQALGRGGLISPGLLTRDVLARLLLVRGKGDA